MLQRVVEIVPQRLIGVGQIVIDPVGQILVDDRAHRLAKAIVDQFPFLGDGFLLRLLLGHLGFLDINRDRQIHVEKHGLYQAAERFAELVGAHALVRQQATLGRRFHNDTVYKVVENDGVTTHVPSWLKPDLSMNLADDTNFLDKLLPEIAIRDVFPVTFLAGLGASDMLF